MLLMLLINVMILMMMMMISSSWTWSGTSSGPAPGPGRRPAEARGGRARLGGGDEAFPAAGEAAAPESFSSSQRSG